MAFAQTETQTAQTTNSDDSNDSESATEKKYFEERSAIHEIYWLACDANRRNGPQVFNIDGVTVSETEQGISEVLDDYRYFQDEKSDLIEEITGELDMFGLRKYREDFPEPDENLWIEECSEHYGIPITGVHEVPKEEALERFDVDYDSDVDEIYVPTIDNHSSDEVYDPMDFYDAEAEKSVESNQQAAGESSSMDARETSPSEKNSTTGDSGIPETLDTPADPGDALAYLEAQGIERLNKGEKGALLKLQDPSRTNNDIAEEVGCTKNTVANGLKRIIGDEGYEFIKTEGRRKRSSSSSSKPAATESNEVETDGGEPEPTKEADSYTAQMTSETSTPKEEATKEPERSEGETVEVSKEELQAMWDEISEMRMVLKGVRDELLSL